MRYYSSTAGEMELQATITDASVSMQVDAVTGLPGTTPFTLVIDPGGNEEIVDVTNVAGTTLTITRGVDGSPAQSHAAGVKIRHMATARDFREAQEHINAEAGVHGVTGDVVGTSDSQTLSNKNLASGTNTFPSSLATSSALSSHVSSTSAHGVSGAIVGTNSSQTLTNKDLSSSSNVFPSSLATDVELSAHTSATAAHGASGAVVGTTNSQTLTNKTISGSNNTLSNISPSSITGLTAEIDDTGWLSAGVSITAASGWSLGGYFVRRRHGVVSVQITVTRTGVALGAGNIGNSNVVFMPSGWIPSESNGQMGAGASGPDHSTYASKGGALIMTNTNNGIGNGAVVQLMGCYML